MGLIRDSGLKCAVEMQRLFGKACLTATHPSVRKKAKFPFSSQMKYFRLSFPLMLVLVVVLGLFTVETEGGEGGESRISWMGASDSNNLHRWTKLNARCCGCGGTAGLVVAGVDCAAGWDEGGG